MGICVAKSYYFGLKQFVAPNYFLLFLYRFCLLLLICIGLNCGVILRVLHEDFPSSKASELGTYLDLSPPRLQEFNHNNPRDCKKLLQDVISYWLETDSEKSWTKLAKAVELCGHKALAEKMKQESTKGVF